MGYWRSCYDCLYQNIHETSYEWIDCFCRKQGGRQVNIRNDCPLFIQQPTTEEKAEYICDLLNSKDWKPQWPLSPEDKLIQQVLQDVTNYLIENNINIKKED